MAAGSRAIEQALAAGRSSSAKGARSRWSRPFANGWESIRYCWAGGWTTTTPTARTKSSAWPIFSAASRPAPTCGKSWPGRQHKNRPEAPPRQFHRIFASYDRCSIAGSSSKTPTWFAENCTSAARRPTSTASSRSKPTRKAKQAEVETLNRQANEVSKSIGKAKDAAEREARKDEGRRLREATTAAGGRARHDRRRSRRHPQDDSQPDASRRSARGRRPGESGSPPRPARRRPSSTSSRSTTSCWARSST